MARAIYQEYKVVSADTAAQLEEKVNTWCEDFWKPLGQPVIEQVGTMRIWHQAMTLNKSKYVA